MKKFIILFSILTTFFSFSQKIEKLPLRKFKIAVLSDSLRENSGLTFFKNKLYTINDSGNTNEVFEIDKNNGEISKKIKTEFLNKDWEAITNDGEHLFVGDFGNNAGNRRDLMVYRINDSANNQSSVNEIPFEYKEQTDFSIRYVNHDFDAEAMVFLNGNIHIFTKEWKAKNISHYIINTKSTEKQSVEKKETFKLGFVVTDASYFQGKLYVVGYTKKAKVYMMIFEEDSEGLFFSKPLKKYRLGSALTVGQVEGIAVNDDGIYISNESFSKFIFNAKQHLYLVPFENLK